MKLKFVLTTTLAIAISQAGNLSPANAFDQSDVDQFLSAEDCIGCDLTDYDAYEDGDFVHFQGPSPFSLRESDFTGANLRDITIFDVYNTREDLNRPDDDSVNQFLNVNFTGANLSEVGFYEEYLGDGVRKGPTFYNTILTNTNLSGQDLPGLEVIAELDAYGDDELNLLTDATGVNFEGSLLENAVFAAADPYSTYRGFTFGGPFAPPDTESLYSMKNANFANANLRNAGFHLLDLSGSSFTNADLTNAVFEEVDLSGVNFTGANLTGADFIESSGTDFTRAILDGVTARNTTFADDSFEGASLQGGVWLGSDLSGSNFTNADLTDSAFRNVNLLGATISDEQISSLSSFTGTLPDGTEVVPEPLTILGSLAVTGFLPLFRKQKNK